MALTAGLFGCGDPTGEPEPCGSEVAEIDLGTSPLVLERVRGGTWIEPTFANDCGHGLSPGPGEVTWSSSDSGLVSVQAVQGAMEPVAFVWALAFGTATIAAETGGARAELVVEVVDPGTEASAFTVVDAGDIGPYTTDLWVHGDHAYTGSAPWSCGGSCDAVDGWLYVWQIGAAGGLTRVDSMALPAAKVNDIKVSADGNFAVASQELGGPGENGIVVLGLTDPAAPTVEAIHTAGLDGGVHNVWIERIDGRDYVFTVGGPSGEPNALHVIDVTDRTNPTQVASYYAGDSFAHDVYVRDGLAFVSHWNAGLVILDVGNGMGGGSPDAPVEVSRLVTDGGHAHNAWYWPGGDVVFVGEEQFPPPDRLEDVGVVHVVDVSDMAAPVEVATFGVPGATPHNFWLDEDAGILFVGWYENGLRAIDVTGTLTGDLSDQARDLGYIIPSGHRGAGSVWAPQLHNGVVYMSDIYNGLWAVTLDG